MKFIGLLAALLLVSGSAHAEMVVQRWPSAGPLPAGVDLFASSISHGSSATSGQTITADFSGRLISFDVLLSRSPLQDGADPVFYLSLYAAPGGSLLTSQAFAAPLDLDTGLRWVSVDVADAKLQLTSGAGLFYTLTSNSAALNTNVRWMGAVGSGPGLYAGGQALINIPGSCAGCETWLPYTDVDSAERDYAFRMTIDTAATAVPEPATWLLLILGYAAIGAGCRRSTAIALARA